MNEVKTWKKEVDGLNYRPFEPRSSLEAKIIERYFHYLLDSYLFLDEKSRKNKLKYLFGLRILFREEYFSPVPKDENRGFDGKLLRLEFCSTKAVYNLKKEALEGPPTCLEVLIGLAKRMDFMLTPVGTSVKCDTNVTQKTSQTFSKTSQLLWGMLENMGFVAFVTKNVTLCDVFVQICENFRHKKWAKSRGEFPFLLQKWPENVEKTELWALMNQYLMEKYPD